MERNHLNATLASTTRLTAYPGLLGRRVRRTGLARRRHRSDALQLGEQLRPVGPRRFGQPIPPGLFQRFALRHRLRLQPLDR